MDDFLRRLQQLLTFNFENVKNVVDILLVAYLTYRVLTLVRGTRAWRILGGILIFVAALYLSDVLGLRTLHWILDKATLLAPVALVILLLPELRQALEGFAKIGLWPDRLQGTGDPVSATTVEEIVGAASEMRDGSVGAIIVVERATKLDEVIANGVTLNAKVSSPLLASIFFEGNALHDGAVVIRGDQIVAASCRLPLSESPRLDQNMHMRHRAGVGITEVADCVVVIVSEQRGQISTAVDGTLTKINDSSELREFLNQHLRPLRNGSRRRKREKVTAG